MGRFAKLVASTALLVGGFVVGMAVDDDPPSAPERPREVVQVPKYIERTKTITKTTIPEECIKAVKASQSLSEAVNQYEQKVGKLPAILDDSYRAIHNQSLTDINKLKSRQQDAASGSIAALVKLREMMQVTASEQRRCEAALK